MSHFQSALHHNLGGLESGRLSSLTFVVNLNRNHWVTVVVARAGGEGEGGKRKEELPRNLPVLDTSRSLGWFPVLGPTRGHPTDIASLKFGDGLL